MWLLTLPKNPRNINHASLLAILFSETSLALFPFFSSYNNDTECVISVQLVIF